MVGGRSQRSSQVLHSRRVFSTHSNLDTQFFLKNQETDILTLYENKRPYIDIYLDYLTHLPYCTFLVYWFGYFLRGPEPSPRSSDVCSGSNTLRSCTNTGDWYYYFYARFDLVDYFCSRSNCTQTIIGYEFCIFLAQTSICFRYTHIWGFSCEIGWYRHAISWGSRISVKCEKNRGCSGMASNELYWELSESPLPSTRYTFDF